MKMRIKHIILLVVVLALSVGFYQNRSYIFDTAYFLLSFVKNPTNVGAVAPSSPFLAEAIVKYVGNKRDIKILEVGAGTGVFTKEIISRLGANAIFDVVEIDGDFVKMLHEKFGNHENVRIHHLSVLDLNPSYKYDVIISGVPLNAFDAELASKILEKYQELIVTGGMLSYFEYVGAAFARSIITNNEKNISLSEESLTTAKQLVDRFEIDSETVLVNVPPATVHHLKMP